MVGYVLQVPQVSLQDAFDVAFEEPESSVCGASLSLRVSALGDDLGMSLTTYGGMRQVGEDSIRKVRNE